MKRWICQEVWGAPSVTNSRVEFALVTETSRLARSLVQTVLGAASGDVVSVARVFPNLDWVNSRMCLERCSRTTPFYDPSLFLSLSLSLSLSSSISAIYPILRFDPFLPPKSVVHFSKPEISSFNPFLLSTWNFENHTISMRSLSLILLLLPALSLSLSLSQTSNTGCLTPIIC